MSTSTPSSSSSLEHLRDWVGRSEQRDDLVTAAPLAGFNATLDRAEAPAPVAGTPLPPLAHWLYFLPQAPAREIGVDGHPKRGGFLPPVPLPRRMWAGGRLSFAHPVAVGEAVSRRSTIVRVDAKHGRSGALVFVTVKHEVSNARGVAITEEHDIVYRDNPEPNAVPPTPAMAPTDAQFSRAVEPDPVLLFRYSALTFNGHRIHYDRPYVTEVEGYPGLIVHGPLIATLLVDLLRRERPNAVLKQFEFKAASPLFDIHPFSVCGKREADGGFALWARNPLGQLAMSARAVIEH
ncbi:MAG TPA: MaoC family dehydratase N-terminal domain-containing protein [Burkholderiaceae bacterium]